ncbi:MAG: hypothetical protein R3F62_16660 [Planctomycetota bacterium]
MQTLAEQLEARIHEHLVAAEQGLKRSIEVKEARGEPDVILMANLGNLYATELEDLDQALFWIKRSYEPFNGIEVSRLTAGDILMTQSQDLYAAGEARGVPHEELVEQCRPYWQQARELYKSYLGGKKTDPQFVRIAQGRLDRVEKLLAGRFDELDGSAPPPFPPGQ